MRCGAMRCDAVRCGAMRSIPMRWSGDPVVRSRRVYKRSGRKRQGEIESDIERER